MSALLWRWYSIQVPGALGGKECNSSFATRETQQCINAQHVFSSAKKWVSIQGQLSDAEYPTFSVLRHMQLI